MRLTAIFIATALALVACSEADNTELPASAAPAAELTDAELQRRVSVSGVSSGAYMAVQSQVALAHRVGGVASVAGGPYHCAGGNVRTALGPCLSGDGVDVAALVEHTRATADSGDIAATAALADTRVWIFHSPADAVVAPTLGVALAEFYGAFVPRAQIALVDHVETAHGWPTLDRGIDCMQVGGDYLNACNYDTAGQLLQHLHPDMVVPPPTAPAGDLRDLDLSRYFGKGSSVAETGFAFVPASCAGSTLRCRLHIAFHGCLQGAQFIDNRFAADAGYNRWAAANDTIVVYPQVEKKLTNPNGCWDWWGYTGNDYDLASGKQIAGVNAIIDAFASQTLLR